MSYTGFWIIGVVPEETLAAVLAEVDPAQFASLDGADDLEWWSAMDHEPITDSSHRHWGTDAAQRFEEQLQCLTPDDAAIDRCINALHDAVEGGTFAEGARKGNPFAALCYGLTFDAARKIPGRGGCFLLSAAEARATLDSLGPVLESPPGGRDGYGDRADLWANVMTDAGGLDTLELLDGLLRMLRCAAETGCGVIAVTQFW